MSAKSNAKVSQVNYNRAVRTARSASAKAGNAMWVIGDAALTVVTEYGENTLKRFSDDISVEISTVRNYRTMCAKFPADGDVARDLQSPTVYGIFTSQDDASDLVTNGQIESRDENGQNGDPWTVSAARALVKSRKDALSPPAVKDPEDKLDPETVIETDIAKLARLQAYRAQLAADLVKTDAAIAALEAAMGPAQHIQAGIPQHDATSPRTDCDTCKSDGIVPMPAAGSPRRSRSRKTAA